MERHLDTPTTAGPATESRNETVERVIGDAPRSAGIDADPSSRRRVGSRISATAVGVALATALMAFVIVLLASAGIGLALGLAGATGLGAGIIAALVMAEREDGRVEREVHDDSPPA